MARAAGCASLGRGAVIRTLPNAPDKFIERQRRTHPSCRARPPTGWSQRGIEHLVLDVPSADRSRDGGALTAHRILFGLPPGSSSLGEAQRRDCTITELAYIPDSVTDGWYFLSLQIPAIAGDAIPSRPVLYPLRTHERGILAAATGRGAGTGRGRSVGALSRAFALPARCATAAR